MFRNCKANHRLIFTVIERVSGNYFINWNSKVRESVNFHVPFSKFSLLKMVLSWTSWRYSEKCDKGDFYKFISSNTCRHDTNMECMYKIRQQALWRWPLLETSMKVYLLLNGSVSYLIQTQHTQTALHYIHNHQFLTTYPTKTSNSWCTSSHALTTLAKLFQIHQFPLTASRQGIMFILAL